MAVNPNATFPTQTTPPSSAYPYGGAQNITSPGDGTGTPWVALLVNDIFGLLQGLLTAASITPSGDADTATNSQYLQALNALFNQSAAGSTSAAGLLQLSDNPASNSTALAATINAVRQVSVALTPVVAGNAAKWRVQVGRIKIQGGIETVSAQTQTPVTFSGAQTPYTALHAAFVGYFISDGNNDNEPCKSSVISLSQGRLYNVNNVAPRQLGYVAFGWDS